MFHKLAISFLLATSVLQAEIEEIQKIDSVKNYLQENTLVLLNVGDTLFSAPSMLADNQWREYFVERANQITTNPEAAKNVIDEVKALIVEKIPKMTPEANTADFIAKLQNEKTPVFGYSMRNYSTTYAPNNDQITYNQLINLNIDLLKTLVYYPAKEYQNGSHAFKYGIIFTNKNPIGPAIVEFLARNDLKPSRIILVGDDLADLKQAQQALSALNIDFQGLRYGRIDERKKSFDKDLGTIEFFAFYNDGKLLSDEEAAQIRAATPHVNYSAKLEEWIRQRVF